MLRESSKCSNYEGRVYSGTSPLLNNVQFVPFELSAAFENCGRRIFFEISTVVSLRKPSIQTQPLADLKATGSVNTKRWCAGCESGLRSTVAVDLAGDRDIDDSGPKFLVVT